MSGTPYINKIHLQDGGHIELDSNSILAVVGANNAGKTYFLKLLRSNLHSVTVEEVPPENNLFHALEIAWRGTGDDVSATALKRASQTFREGDLGYSVNNRIKYPGRSLLREEDFEGLAEKSSSLGPFTDLYLEFDDAIERISETELKRQVRPHEQQEKVSLAQLTYDSEEASNSIRSYFQRIFHEKISYYDRHGDIGFLLAPEQEYASLAGRALNQATKKHMDESPKLWLQGLGMRSVLGLLLKIFATQREILMVDEPEAFLHPPQAAALGGVLANIASSLDKQIILATHDRNLLNGLLKSNDTSVSIQRISRFGTESRLRSIDPQTLSNVRDKSLVRYSTLLDSVFVRMTVLVENEKDAYFYSEVLENLISEEPERYSHLSVDDVLFISTSGKGGLERTGELVTSLRSTVVIACDLDLLADRKQFLSVVKAVSEREPTQDLIDMYDSIIQHIEGEVKMTKEQLNKNIKKSGGLKSQDSTLRSILDSFIPRVDEHKVLLHPLGELEDFAPELVHHRGKAEWAQTALQHNVHASTDAKTFGHRILSHLIP